MTITKKEKEIISQIESAFIKGNTIKNLIVIDAPESQINKLQKHKKLKVKLEVDIDPPGKADYQVKNLLIPIPFQVKLFHKSDLFAGKLHAVICRKWKLRVKGRDLYDFLWYIGQKIPCHLDHLRERMIQTKHWMPDKELKRDDLVLLLKARFCDINFDNAKEDVLPFLKDPQELDLWSNDFFIQMVDALNVC